MLGHRKHFIKSEKKSSVTHPTVEKRMEARHFYATVQYFDNKGHKHTLVKGFDSNSRDAAEREGRRWAAQNGYKFESVHLQRTIQRKNGLQPKTADEIYWEKRNERQVKK